MNHRNAPESLVSWAMSVLGQRECGEVSVVAGDASSRRYFRVRVGRDCYILVDAPPQTEKNEAFVAVHDLLAAGGVRVPEVLGADFERGYLLLEDLGERLLLPALDAQSAEGYYMRAFTLLHKLAAIDSGSTVVPAYDRALLSEELGRFGQWFVDGMLGIQIRSGEEAMLASAFDVLLDSALAQPKVVVHRDFHSRNLMLLKQDELAVIDFQDAVTGPLTYDLVSLLRDCYIRWPDAQVTGWALRYLHALPAALRDQVPDEQTFLRWFDLMGLQRHIKVLGTFARLHLRDQKPGYLADLPLVVRYTEEMLGKYAPEEPAVAEFYRWFTAQLRPRISEQSWSAGA